MKPRIASVLVLLDLVLVACLVTWSVVSTSRDGFATVRDPTFRYLNMTWNLKYLWKILTVLKSRLLNELEMDYGAEFSTPTVCQSSQRPWCSGQQDGLCELPCRSHALALVHGDEEEASPCQYMLAIHVSRVCQSQFLSCKLVHNQKSQLVRKSPCCLATPSMEPL